MREARILYFALGVLVVVAAGAVSLHDDGIEFPDGSFQASANNFTAATAVQGKVTLATTGLVECSGFTTLYTVPANKRLVIEWLAAETEIMGGAVGDFPATVDIRVHNGSGFVSYPFARLENGLVVGSSFFRRDHEVAQVTLYSEANQPVEVNMCLNNAIDSEPIGTVGFSGYLVDV